MRLLVESASRGIVAMALLSPLLGGCDASKAELQETKAKLAVVTTESDGLKAQLDAARASLEAARKERDALAAKLAAAEAAAAAAKAPELPAGPAAPPAAAPGPAKGKKPALSGGKNATLSNALLEKGAAVQQCAIENALEKGAKKVTVSVRVTINSTGQVVDKRVTADVTEGDGAKVKSCVEDVVRTAKFPAIPTPMATDERSWTIAKE